MLFDVFIRFIYQSIEVQYFITVSLYQTSARDDKPITNLKFTAPDKKCATKSPSKVLPVATIRSVIAYLFTVVNKYFTCELVGACMPHPPFRRINN